MAKTYGTIGVCENCLQTRKLHGYVKGVLHCMGCYTKQRFLDPEKKAKQRLAVKLYYYRNKAALRVYNRAYSKLRYATDSEYRQRIIKCATEFRKNAASKLRRSGPSSSEEKSAS